MKKYSALVLLVLVCLGCSKTEEKPSYSYFITQLGNDTLAIERLHKEGDKVFANVVLRSPSTSLTSYELKLDDSGGIQNLTAYIPSAGKGFEPTGGTVAQTIQKIGDSLKIEQTSNNPDRPNSSFMVKYEKGTLPFIDMVHWPFDLAFQTALADPNDSIDQKLLSGRRISGFIIHKLGSDSLTLRHPSRGVMGVKVNNEGGLQKLDAALTTRKLIVKRVQNLDFDRLALNFAERDKDGSPFGALSGAIEEDYSFHGADFTVSYGSPLKRGRTIFGGIVPWGQLWRTGANRATHFKTSKDLEIEGIKVPAGEYTFYTIPAENGGTLIINKQTGQNGQSYDQSRDLGRVPMQMSHKDSVTEPFTITVEETETGGEIRLIWDQTIFSVPFTID